ncbi:MAG: AraC family transcriptional regulator [Clostridia bacterium]|nr:AraC family transcriptional regulator [Clostridia bacterium]
MKKFILPVATEFDLTLPYYFAGVGIRYEQEHIHRPIGHPRYQWIQCREGKGELYLRGNTYTLEEGKGMLLFPNEPHEYFALTPGWTVDWIIFSGTETERFIREILGVRESSVLTVTTPYVLAGKLEDLYDTAVSALPAKNILCSSLVYAILSDLLRFLSSEKTPSMTHRLAKLGPVLAYIEQNYHRPISLSELAEQVGCTPQHFCASFKRVMCQTPLEYVNMVKIRKCKEVLLEHPETSIREAAYSVGFEDVSYFCSIFRRTEGMSPSEFRRLHR